MRVSLCISILLLFSIHILAQDTIYKQLQQARDSVNSKSGFTRNILYDLSKKKDLTDSTKTNIHLELANYYNNKGVLDSVVLYTERALGKTSTKRQNAQAYAVTGSIYYKTGRKEEALKLLLEGLKIAESLEDQFLVGQIKFELGSAYMLKNEFDKALRFYKESLTTADIKIHANVYSHIGNLYLTKRNVRIKDKFNEENYDFIKDTIASNNLERAQHFYNKAIKIAEKDWNINTLLSASTSLGAISLQKGALAHQNKQMDLSRKEFDKAEEVYRKAIEVAKKYNLEDKSILFTYNLGLVQHIKKDTQLGIATMNIALEKAIKASNLEYQKMIYAGLMDAHKRLEEYKSTYEILLQYHKIEDSINKLRFDKDIKELEIQYETAQKEKEITIKENEIKRQKFVKKAVLIGASLVLIPIVILVIVYYQKHKTQMKLNKYQEEINDQKVSELIKDQEIQINKTAIASQNKEREHISQQLHDVVGGNLSFINTKLSNANTKGKDIKLVLTHLHETMDQIRDLSHDLVSKKIESATFISVLKNEISELAIASKKEINLYVHPEEQINEIEPTYMRQLYKIVRELCTNTIKHAQAEKIDIRIIKQENNIDLLFEDNGIGFDVATVKMGLGIQNIKKRIKSLSGSFDIDSTIGKGTVFNISFKL